VAREKVPGFTKAQRTWILKRDKRRCSFMTYDAAQEEWVRCKNTKRLQVHHITPRGFYDCHLRGCGWDVNSPENGIMLCAFHHVGEGTLDEHKPYVIHWDTREAHRTYKGKGRGNSFERMKANRVEFNQKKGRPYWNTRWDWLFKLLVAVRNKNFRRPFPVQKDTSYVRSRKRGTLFTID